MESAGIHSLHSSQLVVQVVAADTSEMCGVKVDVN